MLEQSEDSEVYDIVEELPLVAGITVKVNECWSPSGKMTAIADHYTWRQNTVRVTRTVTVGKDYHHIDSAVAAHGLSQCIFSARHRFTLEALPATSPCTQHTCTDETPSTE